jgi:hypothetical protein
VLFKKGVNVVKKILLFVFGIIISYPAIAFTSTQTDIISMFEKMDAMLEVGTTRVDIQRQLADIKVSINRLQEQSPESEFTQKANSLFQQITSCFLISDLMPTKKSALTAAHDTIKELLPELKSLTAPKKKKK